MADRKATEADWKRIRDAYEKGDDSHIPIYTSLGISRARVSQKASRENWIRGGSPADKIVQAEILHKVRERLRKEPLEFKKTAIVHRFNLDFAGLEKKIVDKIMNRRDEVLTNVLSEHAALTHVGKEILKSFMAELNAQNGAVENLDEAISILVENGNIAKEEATAIMQAMSFPARIKYLQSLADSMTKIVELERRTYTLDSKYESREKEVAQVESPLLMYDKDFLKQAVRGA